MRAAFEDRSVSQAVTELQRLAMRAAMIGFSISLGIAILYTTMPRFAASKTGMRSALEGLCVLLWPSAVLMLGAQTYHGGTVLFLLSACLNAGYFVLAAMVLATVIHRLNLGASPSKTSAVTGQRSGRRLAGGLRRAGPIA
jgi:formate/nitrite transporter FocA (FNT family)